MSDYVWGYCNEIAKELYLTHPDKKLSVDAYTTYRMPPLNIDELSPNLVVIIDRWAHWISEGTIPSIAAWPTPRYQNYLEEVAQWMNLLTSNEVFIDDYYTYGMSYEYPGNPVYLSRLVKKELSMYSRGNPVTLGEFIEVGANDGSWAPISGAEHLNIYVTARLLWDADLDMQALLDDYYEKFYGPAADEMKAFVEYCEVHCMYFNTDSNILTTERTLLNAAIAAAAGSGIYADRVAMMDEFLQLAE